MTSTARRTDISANTGAIVSKGIAGIVGGVAGGLVFGLMMQLMGMMPMIAALVGAESVMVGWLVHLAISSFIGITYAVIFVPAHSVGKSLTTGLAWGLLWWVLGPLVIMPTALGMGVFMFNQTTMMSLVGHLVFGAILGLVATLWMRRSGGARRAGD